MFQTPERIIADAKMKVRTIYNNYADIFKEYSAFPNPEKLFDKFPSVNIQNEDNSFQLNFMLLNQVLMWEWKGIEEAGITLKLGSFLDGPNLKDFTVRIADQFDIYLGENKEKEVQSFMIAFTRVGFHDPDKMKIVSFFKEIAPVYIKMFLDLEHAMCKKKVIARALINEIGFNDKLIANLKKAYDGDPTSKQGKVIESIFKLDPKDFGPISKAILHNFQTKVKNGFTYKVTIKPGDNYNAAQIDGVLSRIDDAFKAPSTSIAPLVSCVTNQALALFNKGYNSVNPIVAGVVGSAVSYVMPTLSERQSTIATYAMCAATGLSVAYSAYKGASINALLNVVKDMFAAIGVTMLVEKGLQACNLGR